MKNGFTNDFNQSYHKYFIEDFERQDDLKPLLRGKFTHPSITPDYEGLKNGLTERLNIRQGVTLGKEFLLTAPKSLSILFFKNPERVLSAFKNAREIFLNALDELIETRGEVSSNGGERKREIRNTQNTVSFLITHQITRTGRPHLHSHVLILNTTFDAKEGRWKAFNVSKMGLYNANNTLKKFWAETLKKEVEKEGFETVEKGESWEVKGISDALIKKYSSPNEEKEHPKPSLSEEMGVVSALKKEISETLTQSIKEAPEPLFASFKGDEEGYLEEADTPEEIERYINWDEGDEYAPDESDYLEEKKGQPKPKRKLPPLPKISVFKSARPIAEFKLWGEKEEDFDRENNDPKTAREEKYFASISR